MNTCIRPSALEPSAIESRAGQWPPRECHPDQPPFTVVWEAVYNWPSLPMRNTCIRPSALPPSAIESEAGQWPPRECHPDQPPFAVVWEAVYNWLSLPMRNTCIRPSALEPSAIESEARARKLEAVTQEPGAGWSFQLETVRVAVPFGEAFCSMTVTVPLPLKFSVELVTTATWPSFVAGCVPVKEMMSPGR